MIYRLIVLSVLLVGFGCAAEAGCVDDIRAMMEADISAKNFRLEAEVSADGTVIQHSSQQYKDYSHFYQFVKETGIHWLVLGNQEYLSKDGKAWSASQKRDADWLEKEQAQNKLTRETISETSCETETKDGRSYKVFRHKQVIKEPVESASDVTSWIDEKTGKLAMRVVKTESFGQSLSTFQRYFWEEIVLPTP